MLYDPLDDLSSSDRAMDHRRGIAPHRPRRRTAARSGATRQGRSAPLPVFWHCPRSAGRPPASRCSMIRGHVPSAVGVRLGLTVHPAQVLHSQPPMARGYSKGLDMSGRLVSGRGQHRVRSLDSTEAYSGLGCNCTRLARTVLLRQDQMVPDAERRAVRCADRSEGGVGDAGQGGQAHGRPYRVPSQLQRLELTRPAHSHSKISTWKHCRRGSCHVCYRMRQQTT
jgi:hypothetical protein